MAVAKLRFDVAGNLIAQTVFEYNIGFVHLNMGGFRGVFLGYGVSQLCSRGACLHIIIPHRRDTRLLYVYFLTYVSENLN